MQRDSEENCVRRQKEPFSGLSSHWDLHILCLFFSREKVSPVANLRLNKVFFLFTSGRFLTSTHRYMEHRLMTTVCVYLPFLTEDQDFPSVILHWTTDCIFPIHTLICISYTHASISIVLQLHVLQRLLLGDSSKFLQWSITFTPKKPALCKAERIENPSSHCITCYACFYYRDYLTVKVLFSSIY